jgi:NADPH:quinone reductase
MRAVAYHAAGPIDRPDALVDVELPDPVPGERDLLVEVCAVGVNPVDARMRRGAAPKPGEAKVLGWDAAGIVRAAGPGASRFQVGEAVFYAGSILRPGANSRLHLVDERIVGRKPSRLDWAAAAALPLTTITAWEMLFDRLEVRRPVAGGARSILVVGAAGGVGSMAVQLARGLTDLTVIGTASRPETAARVERMGAHHVLDHSRPMAPQFAELGLAAPSYVFSTTHSDAHLADVVQLIAPQGRYGLIDDPKAFDVGRLKAKALSLHWEGMFVRSSHQTADMQKQGELLDEVAALIDAGELSSTLGPRLSPICAQTLIEAHRLVESGAAVGKVVVEGWPA